jgi:MFS family permease
VGALIYTLVNLVNAVYAHAPVSYLLIGSVINGMTGGFISVMMAVYSYIGHVASAHNRTIRVGILEAMIFLSGTLGVLVSGAMLDGTSFTFVFAFICGCLALALVYTVLWLPDVKPDVAEGARAASDSGGVSVCRHYFLDAVRDSWLCVVKRRVDRKTVYIAVQVLVIVILMICTSGMLLLKHRG